MHSIWPIASINAHRLPAQTGRIVEFVGWCIMGFVIKAQNDWRDVGRPQVAMHRNCTFSSYLFSGL